MSCSSFAFCSSSQSCPLQLTDLKTTEPAIAAWQPSHCGSWLDAIRRTDDAHLAHQPQWHDAFAEAYGHRPLYLIARDEHDNCAILPAFVINRPFLGPVVASMPFLDGGGPSGSSDILNQKLVDVLCDNATSLGAKWLELRCTKPLQIDTPANQSKVTMVLDLPDDSDLLWRSLNAKVRNLVRKGERSGLTVDTGGADLLDAFYDVFAINMRDLGSPVHPKTFFTTILKAFGEQACVALVKKDHQVIGGLIGIGYHDTFAVPWASSLREYFKLSPNMLLYWQILKQACTHGYKRFDFGRSSRGVGTYRFKKQWGAQEKQLYWYRIPVSGNANTKSDGASSTGSLAVAIWQKMPVGVATWLGARVRGYLTQ